MKPRYDGLIEVREMQPMSTGKKYFAKIGRLYLTDADGNRTSVSPPGFERWGADREEAARKLRESLQRWADEQGATLDHFDE
jgi:hypothetical protein